jgi:hypothetical protein
MTALRIGISGAYGWLTLLITSGAIVGLASAGGLA